MIVNQPWPADRPFVSVVISCFNYGQFLDEALESVYAQTLQDFEVIVVEGGSTDGTTPQKVRAIEHPRVRKLFQDQPTRVGHNRLRGVSEARGKYVVFLDADDKLEPTYLEKAVLALELGGADLAYPSVQLFERETSVWETADEFTLKTLTEANCVATVAMFRRETWEALDIGYGTDIDLEDWDFWLRFAEKGARGFHIAEALMLYRVHGQSLTDSLRAREVEVRRGVLAMHPLAMDELRVAEISRHQLVRPIVRAPQANLGRIERRSPRSLRVAVAMPWLAGGSLTRLLLQLFSDLGARDTSLLVYSTLERPPESESQAAAFRRLTDDVFELPTEVPSEACGEAMVHLLRSRGTQVLMLAGSPQTYDLLPRLRNEMPGLRVVNYLDDTLGHVPPNRCHAKEIDVHIVASEEVRDVLLAAGEEAGRIAVIYPGLDMKRYDLATVPYGNLPDLPVSAHQKLVLYAGRFSTEASMVRFADLAHAMRGREDLVFAMMSDDFDLVAGDGQRRHLREEGCAHWLGFVDDPRRHLRRADVVVIPSSAKGLPLLCLEALALGTPVIAPNVGAMGEVIRSDVTGFLANPRDHTSYVEAISRAVELDGHRERLAETCRASVRERFAIEAVRQKYFGIFRRLAT